VRPPTPGRGPDAAASRRCRTARRAQSLAALLGILLLAIAISPTASDGSRIFLQAGNLTDILRQVSLIGIISLAMTFVILTGGIDLSVGSILALSTALAAMFLTRGYTTHIAVAILAAVAAAGGGGAERRGDRAHRIQPFIVTLASMIGVRGLAKWLTNNQNIDIGFGKDLAAEFAAIFREKAIVIGAYAAAAALFWVVLARTVFGRHVRAVGDNEKAAEYAGLPIRATKIWVYTLSGLFTGFRRRAVRGGEPSGQSQRGRGLRTGCHRGGGDRRHAALRRQGLDFRHHRRDLDYGRADEYATAEQCGQQCGDDDQGGDHRPGGGGATREERKLIS
jgi:ribose transport system permease protein